MNKIILAFAAAVLLTVGCFAQSPAERLGSQLGVDELIQAAPQSARKLAGDVFEGGFSYEKLLSVSPKELYTAVKEEALQSALRYRGELLAVLTAVVLCAVLAAVGQSGDTPDVFGMICTLSITSILLRPVLSCVESCCGAIRELSQFMLAYIPVYATVMATSGAAGGAAVYQTAVMAASQVLSGLSSEVFIPLLQGCLLLDLSGAIGGNKGIAALSSGIKKLINWGLVLTATAFTGILSLQSVITSAADGAASKTVKFLAGSFVPVIGSAFSDAFSAIRGSLSIIKATVGGFGVAVAVVSFMPVLINITVLRIVIWLAKTAGETLSAHQAAGVLGSFLGVLATMTALLMCTLMLLTISTAIMMKTAAGGM